MNSVSISSSRISKAKGAIITRTAWHNNKNCRNASSSSSTLNSAAGRRRLFSTTTPTLSEEHTADAASTSRTRKIPVSWLDLRGSGLSILERLLLEECLLRHDPESRNWIVVGHHDAHQHRYLRQTSTPPYIHRARQEHDAGNVENQDDDDTYGSGTSRNAYYNPSTAIVLGIGGKPELLLNIDAVQRDGVVCYKRFSGGGTVVVDADCIWTTLIFQQSNTGKDEHSHHNHHQQHHEDSSSSPLTLPPSPPPSPQDQQQQPSAAPPSSLFPQPYPRDIMEWTSRFIFKPLFDRLQQQPQHQPQHQQQRIQQAARDHNGNQDVLFKPTLIMDTKSCGAVDNAGRVVGIPVPTSTDASRSSSRTNHDHSNDDYTFALRENDYVLGNYKMGGNAQSIVQHGRWLHHTSFLWDYDEHNMQNYLLLPKKRPAYRVDRSHDKFLVKLKDVYSSCTKNDFYKHFWQALVQQQQQPYRQEIDSKQVDDDSSRRSNRSSIFQVEKVSLSQAMAVVDKQGGMQTWFEGKGKASRTRVLMELPTTLATSLTTESSAPTTMTATK
jgi:lipoate-protein ligase A